MKLNIEHILDGKWDEEKLLFNIDCFNLIPSRTQIYFQFGYVLEEIKQHPPLLVTNSPLLDLVCLPSELKDQSQFVYQSRFQVLNLVCHQVRYEPGLFEKLENYAIHRNAKRRFLRKNP